MLNESSENEEDEERRRMQKYCGRMKLCTALWWHFNTKQWWPIVSRMDKFADQLWPIFSIVQTSTSLPPSHAFNKALERDIGFATTLGKGRLAQFNSQNMRKVARRADFRPSGEKRMMGVLSTDPVYSNSLRLQQLANNVFKFPFGHREVGCTESRWLSKGWFPIKIAGSYVWYNAPVANGMPNHRD